MSFLTQLMPIIIIVVIIGLVIFMTMRRKNRRGKFFYGKRIEWFLKGYIFLLLITTILFFIIPSLGSVQSEKIDMVSIPNLHNSAIEGKLDEIANPYLIDQQDIDYESDQLYIGALGDFGYAPFIQIERKKEDDDVIEVTTYQTPTVIEGIDITEYVEALQVEVDSETLKIILPEEPADLKFGAFKTEFPITQFTEGNWWMGENVAFGEWLLNIRIPKDLEIDVDEALNVYYVDE